MKLADRTFVISLVRRADRRARFEALAAHVGLEDWSFFDAFDGAAMGLTTSVGQSCRATSTPQPMSPGEIGCTLSHVAVARAALALGLPSVGVLEDDAVGFAEDAEVRHAELVAQADLQVGLWMHRDPACPVTAVPGTRIGRVGLIPDVPSTVPGSPAWGSYGYFLRPDGMRALAQTPSHPLAVTDWFLCHAYRTLPTYVADHPLVITGTADSDVEPTNVGLWDGWYRSADAQPYGSEETYGLGATWLQGLAVEDWGGGYGWFSRVCRRRQDDDPSASTEAIRAPRSVLTVDGSRSPFADVVEDLVTRTSAPEGIFLRHVLEHERRWQALLRNALRAFQKRMAIVVFTPWNREGTKVIHETVMAGGARVPDLSFCREEFVRELEPWLVSQEDLMTNTQYGGETVFYLAKGKEKNREIET